MGISAVEQNREKTMKKKYNNNLRDLRDNIKHTTIQIIVVSEEEKESLRKYLKRL